MKLCCLKPLKLSLSSILTKVKIEVTPLLEDRLYAQAMEVLAGLKESVDNFFDQVLVNAEDEAVRLNRYALLKQLRSLFLHVADISLLQKS